MLYDPALYPDRDVVVGHTGFIPNCVFVDSVHTAVTYCDCDGNEHGVHTPVDEYVPGAHFARMHDVAVTEPNGDVVPIGQDVGCVVPSAGQYVFAGHGIHG